MNRLRDDVLPGIAADTGAAYLVGGSTAATEDYADKVAGRMPLFVTIVVGLSVLLLMIVFRSLLVPLKAALFNLLSIGAALGAFMLSPDRLLQQTGFGMAVAVFVDAVIIRCLLVPATMHLLGRHAWWLPAPLERALPRLEVER